MKRTILLLGSIALAGAAFISVHAQELVVRVEEPVHSRSLSGIVIASDNEPVPQAIVELRSQDWKRVLRKTATDYDGSFKFKNARRGIYRLRIWARGFQHMEFEVKVDRSGQRRPKFMLEIGT